ncbi:bacillithiol biosynthesis cysteine-adding enzyme BshC [Ornithinibacillus contaminans]|uniref:bacillithiol biosynthesis cysteine-adding enzyme BshC n=1 Tax=Ornithinibacillus contaminans TaxID=694055 RepID=UPI00064E14A7|nr:bacillithiol biosynthesis cysteine-adding enzyme BshC [Ornithinibacillus contaminans]
MRIEPLHIKNKNTLIRDYRDQQPAIMQNFDYGITDYQDRLAELTARTYKRQQLVEVLITLNKGWNAPSATFENIERLKSENSVVVIGGQQAGLLTGPLYSINKVISIVQLAKQQEELLGVPVIPVFWVAGEDHDFEEINHTYMLNQTTMKKFKVQQRVLDKRSVSSIELDKATVSEWVDRIISQLPETAYTTDLHQIIQQCLEQSITYVDFFAQLIYQLFPDTGLVLMDSGAEQIRKLERDYFIEMIQKQREISTGVANAYETLAQAGYNIPLDVTKQDGNLFYHKDFERILLSKNAQGHWVGKQNEVILTEQELLDIAMQTPEKLSNNVVTRPLMQDLVFPTLAFIGGPGEISYWSVLKPAFHALGIKMPPVVPRLSFTYVEPQLEKTLNLYDISIQEAINNGVQAVRDQWFKEKINPSVEETASEIKQLIEKAHEPLRMIAKGIRADIGDLADKNLEYLLRDVAFLEKRIMKALEERYEKELTDFNLLEASLHPEGLQERIWNPLPFINRHGLECFVKMTTEYCSVEQDHYIVYF